MRQPHVWHKRILTVRPPAVTPHMSGLLNDSSTWVPEESSESLWNERSFLAGMLIGAVAYGVHATLFFTTLSLLFKKKRAQWKDYTWIAYVLALFTISSIGNYGQLKYTEEVWIDNRNYPGGPGAYLVEQRTVFSAKLVVASFMINGWLQDGLILYRFWVFFGGHTLAVVIPCMMFLGTVGASSGLIGVIPTTPYFEGIGAKLLIAYYAQSVGLNLVATVAISTKLLMARRLLRQASQGISTSYISISAILIESAFLYTACGVVFLVPFGLQDPFQNIMLPTLAQVESIAPLLIIMRVAQGQAWSAETTTQVANSTMKFTHGTRRVLSTANDLEQGHTDTVALAVLSEDQDDNATKVDRATFGSGSAGDHEQIFRPTKA